ncbi:MAG: CHAT domain-containing protein [Calditrichaeota bacterium]|nr:MAG: CHAT domain-containing protein [Calditrichota bacterium]MBL1205754.1 CHAT domain-containing protein [Calditrichota bacterium]NOG45582.1 CHAT domain-containing protein [Calditrichota bacterium]
MYTVVHECYSKRGVNSIYSSFHYSLLFILALFVFFSLAGASQKTYLPNVAIPVVDSTKIKLANQHFKNALVFKKKEQFDSSLFYLNLASKVYWGISDYENYINSLRYILINNFRQKNYSKAKKVFDKIVKTSITYEIENHPIMAKVYYNFGSGCRKTGEYLQALKYLELAKKIKQKNKLTYVGILVNTGNVYFDIGEYDKALTVFTTAYKMRLDKYGKKHIKSVFIFKNIADVLLKKGYYEKALSHYNEVLPFYINKYGSNHSRLSTLYSNISTAYHLKGDYEFEKVYLKKAVEISIANFGINHAQTAILLTNLAITHRNLGNNKKAREYYLQVINIYLKIYKNKARSHIANTYYNYAELLSKENNIDAKSYYLKAIAIMDSLEGGHSDLKANMHMGLGYFLHKNKLYSKADIEFQIALKLVKRPSGGIYSTLAECYRYMGDNYSEQKFYKKALISYDESISASGGDYYFGFLQKTINNIPLNRIELLETVTSKGELFRKKMLEEKSSGEEKIKLAKNAVHNFDLASKLLTELQTNYIEDRSKLNLSKKSFKIYDNILETLNILYNLTNDETFLKTAFLYAEKNKVAVLTQALKEARVKKFVNIPDSVLIREKALLTDITYHEITLQKLYARNDNPDQTKIAEIQNTLFKLKTDHGSLKKHFEMEYPQYYELKYKSVIPSVETIQNRLDANSALIEYVLGSKTLSIFTITKDNFFLTRVPLDTFLLKKVDQFKLSLVKVSESAHFTKWSYHIYNKIFKPIESFVSSKQKLILIPDGKLYYFPFEALVRKFPEDSLQHNNYSDLDYLINDFEFVYHYSGKLYLQSFEESKKDIDFDYNIAAFAPVFGNQNGEVIETEISLVTKVKNYFYSKWRNGKSFSPLLHSEKEAESIINMFRDYKKKSKAYLNSAATEKTFKNEAGKFKYLHIATHSFFDKEMPHLSGIVFAEEEDSSSHEDGILYSGEIYNLDIRSELVVLSSCESGYGKILKGEGIMAMTRGFLYSGASNILASLWPVSDMQTYNLMLPFYKGIRNLKSYSAALRETKLTMIKDKASSFPSIWSGFILIGR